MILGSMLSHGVIAQTPTAETQPVDLEVFKGPRSKDLKPPAYPMGELVDDNEGWVHLNFMIDPDGKPYEISVADSTGIPAFERAAIKAAQAWRFEPATLNGQPIDAGHTMKVQFRLTDLEKGAKPEFGNAYRKTVKAIRANDQAEADRNLARMKVTNLYEDAFFNLARFLYFEKWGTSEQQLKALERAVAYETDAKYLPKDAFEAALLSLLNLRFKTRDFTNFLSVWNLTQARKMDHKNLEKWRPVVDDIVKLKSDQRTYSVNGAFEEATSWRFDLYKQKFQIAVESGRIAEVKLRCEKKYVFFKFDPTLQYKINDRFGACSMELIGDPGTKFTLVQL